MASPSRGSARSGESHDARSRTQGIYNRLSRSYDMIADASEREARAAGLALLSPAAGESLLEIGCGTGRALRALEQAAGPLGRVVGLDLASGMLAAARHHLEEVPSSQGVRLVQADGSLLPFAAAVFDAAFLCFTLELFPAWTIPSVIQGVSRVLRPGGRLGVVALWRTRPAPPATRVYDWFHHRFPHLVDCQPIDVPEVLRRSGFAVARSRELRTWGLPVMAVVALRAI